MNVVYHIVSATDWASQESQPEYRASSLQTEGFIHLSQKEQVPGTLSRYYQNVPDLLLIHIDADRLTNALLYEVTTNHEQFPHLYGPLNKDAVVTIEQLN